MELEKIISKSSKEIDKALPLTEHIKVGSLIYNKDGGIKTLQEILAITKDYAFTSTNNVISLHDIKHYYDVITKKNFDLIKAEYLKIKLFPKTEAVFKNFLTSTVENQFGRYDDYEIRQSDVYIHLTLYYKELELLSESGETHKLLDVYIKYTFLRDWYAKTILLTNMQMFRTTYTIGEVINDYMFSHCDYGPGRLATSFCLGSEDTPIYKAYHQARRGINPFQILHFLHTMHEYFTWESISGTPYRYISKIKNYKSGIEVNSSLDSRSFNKMYNYILHNIQELKFEYIPKGVKYEAVTTSDMLSEISKLAVEWLKIHKKFHYIGYNFGGRVSVPEAYSNTDIEIQRAKIQDRANNTLFRFKGKKPNITVIDGKNSFEEIIKDLVETIHPELLMRIRKNINSELTLYIYLKQNSCL